MKRSQHLKLSHLKTKFIHLNNRNCQACWKCVEKCPQKVIGRINLPFHKHTRLDYPEKCTGCLRCMKICEHDAIQRIVTI